MKIIYQSSIWRTDCLLPLRPQQVNHLTNDKHGNKNRIFQRYLLSVCVDVVFYWNKIATLICIGKKYQIYQYLRIKNKYTFLNKDCIENFYKSTRVKVCTSKLPIRSLLPTDGNGLSERSGCGRAVDRLIVFCFRQSVVRLHCDHIQIPTVLCATFSHPQL